jgi:predicted nucleotidyltransferase
MTDDLWQHVILKVVVGSRAFGLDHAGSDTDRRGIYLPPATRHWSLAGVPEQLEDDATQETYWELGKFIGLALKANPNVLETLYSPLVEHASPFARRVIDAREIFLSRRIHQTYSNYAASQFDKIGRGVAARGEPKWKHVMHLMRLLIAGAVALRERRVPVRVADEHRARLIAIRDGQVPFAEVDAWRHALHADFDRALAETTLPIVPDVAAAEALLIEGRRVALDF